MLRCGKRLAQNTGFFPALAKMKEEEAALTARSAG
jgi:hypothetical protein